MLNVFSQLNIKKINAKEIFKKNGIDYQKFVENYKVELMWNTLIYSLYKNQLSINTVEIENDLNKELKEKRKFKEYNLSEIQIIQGPNKDEVNKLQTQLSEMKADIAYLERNMVAHVNDGSIHNSLEDKKDIKF